MSSQTSRKSSSSASRSGQTGTSFIAKTIRSVSIVEVGARDGLQNEDKVLSIPTRIEFIKKLSGAGLKRIEVGSFVSPKRIPQMAHTGEVLGQVIQSKKGVIQKGGYSALVPNRRGMLDAIEAKSTEVSIFLSCSDSFSIKNINCTIKESLKSFHSVVQLAKENRIRVRGYLSNAFGCPYEGKISQVKVASLVQKILDLGVYEVSIGDTIGIANPKQVDRLLQFLLHRGIPIKKIALHMHDTRGMALANILMGILHGVQTFDSSLGGLGGCPYAKGASGNVATEDLIYMLHGMGIQTGVDLKKLTQIKPWIEKKVGRPLPSKIVSSHLSSVQQL